MSVYKYVSLESAMRFLATWKLRITPPHEFNDPFELRPSIELMSEGLVQHELEKAIPEMPDAAINTLMKEIAPSLRQDKQTDLRELLTWAINPAPGGGDPPQHLLDQFPPEAQAGFLSLRQSMPELMEMACVHIKEQASTLVPQLNKMAREKIHGDVPGMIGILCLSRSERHPLMWAHYADCHKGVMLEFDEFHPSFKRRRNAEDEFGYLRGVVYSDTRPTIRYENAEDAFQNLVLTKALEWAYEQEVRLSWPLDQADEVIERESATPIHLLHCPPSALKSATLGCKGNKQSLEALKGLLDDQPSASHVRLRRARMDDNAFALVYEWEPRSAEL